MAIFKRKYRITVKHLKICTFTFLSIFTHSVNAQGETWQCKVGIFNISMNEYVVPVYNGPTRDDIVLAAYDCLDKQITFLIQDESVPGLDSTIEYDYTIHVDGHYEDGRNANNLFQHRRGRISDNGSELIQYARDGFTRASNGQTFHIIVDEIVIHAGKIHILEPKVADYRFLIAVRPVSKPDPNQ